MIDATREKTRLWLLILVGVVATLLGQTHAREIFAPSPHESDVFAAHTQASTGENTTFAGMTRRTPSLPQMGEDWLEAALLLESLK
jgi:hypothetical protein